MDNYGLIITASEEINYDDSDFNKATRGREHVRRNINAKHFFSMFGRNFINASVLKDPTRSQLERAVEIIANNTDENNVSYIYINCHGDENGLVLVVRDDDVNKTTNVSYEDLRKILDTIPGKKVVMIDSCHSGASISSEVNTDEIKKMLHSMNENVISAFKPKRRRRQGRGGSIAPKSGELISEDYYVITACQPDQLSWGNTDGEYFSNKWCLAAGWDYVNSKPIKYFGNKSYVTLDDLCSYTSKEHHEHYDETGKIDYESDQDDMCHPKNSDFAIFAEHALSSNNVKGVGGSGSFFFGLSGLSTKVKYRIILKLKHAVNEIKYSNLRIKLFGSNGDSSFIPINITPEELTNKLIERDVTLKNLGNIKSVTIKSDIFGNNPEMLFETIGITLAGSEKVLRNGILDYTYKFKASCVSDGKWLYKNSLIEVKNELKVKYVYHLNIYVPKKDYAGTDAEVDVCLYGDKPGASTGFIRLKDNPGDDLEQGTKNEYEISTTVDIGKITDIGVRHDNSGEYAELYISKIEIKDKTNGRNYTCNFERWVEGRYIETKVKL